MKKYYLGLDMGTNSVGWAVTDEHYQLLRGKGKDLWGARLFQEAQTAAQRRLFRTSRRRLRRERIRIGYLNEIFAPVIKETDPGFFQRLADSKFWPDDKTEPQPYTLFHDADFTDKDYHKKYPTIFHLIVDLIHSKEPHDARLVYLAVLNIFKHRGNFLNQSLTGEKLAPFTELYTALKNADSQFEKIKAEDLKTVLTDRSLRNSEKKDKLLHLFTPAIKSNSPTAERVKLLCGLKRKLSEAFTADWEEDQQKIAVSFQDAAYDETLDNLHEVLTPEILDILAALKNLHDWSSLSQMMTGEQGTCQYLAEARVSIYEKHKKDLQCLKKAYRAYLDDKAYYDMFRSMGKDNYSAYVRSVNSRNCKVRRGGTCTQENLYKRIKKDLSLKGKDLPKDKQYMLEEIEKETFLPKQLTSANGIIPYQLHLAELKALLAQAETYLPFLREKDASGLTNTEKICQLFSFCIPYYVGPLYKDENGGNHAWLTRRESGKILPWNFEQKVDLKASAANFMQQLVGHCTYLSGEQVLPKESLLYEKFRVLNELNNLRINGLRIDVSLKQRIYQDLFSKGKKVTQKKLITYLEQSGDIGKGEQPSITGIDGDFKNNLSSYARFTQLFNTKQLTAKQETMCEKIILWATAYGESKKFLKEKIEETYPGQFTAQQMKRLLGYKFRDWGRLSRAFLTLEGTDKETGEVLPLIQRMWESNYNLMELLSSRFTYVEEVEKKTAHLEKSLAEIQSEDLDDLYISNPVRRMVWQTILVLKEITQVMKCPPARIFVEMARDNNAPKERKSSRKDRLMELYKAMKKEGIIWLNSLKNRDESELREKKLYLYYCQLGHCMYTGEPIDLQDLFNKDLYDIDHIYPRHFVKDDSLDNNLVLVKKQVNNSKQDIYPLSEKIRQKQHGFWHMLRERGLINQIKYERLVRNTPFTDAEKAGFISRQMVETRQGTKAITEFLQQICPQSKVIYVKAGNVSQFRQQFHMVKCRALNDFHHAHDAYLNILVGNTYAEKFTLNPLHFIKVYEENPQAHAYHMYHMFEHLETVNGRNKWVANPYVEIARKFLNKPSVLITRRSFEQHGGLTDATIINKETVAKSKDKSAYLPIKSTDNRLKNISRYGGKTKIKGSYFFLVESMKKGKQIRTIETMPLFWASQCKNSSDIEKYCKDILHLENPSIRISKIKFYSLLKINNAYVYLTGRSGNTLACANAMQMILSTKQASYVKKVFELNLQNEMNDKYLKLRDISQDNNIQLYELLTQKHVSGIFKNRINPVGNFLLESKKLFISLSIPEQITVLRAVLKLSSIDNTGADFTLIGGSQKQGTSKISKVISNASSAYLIMQSPAGLYSKTIDLLTV